MATGNLINGDASLSGSFSISDRSGKTITLNTGQKFVEKPIELAISIDDSNLAASNIASGVSILGVQGNYTSDATAVASEIISGKTAYINGVKVTGTMEIATMQEVISYLGL